jgi:hypothetical protein
MSNFSFRKTKSNIYSLYQMSKRICVKLWVKTTNMFYPSWKSCFTHRMGKKLHIWDFGCMIMKIWVQPLLWPAGRGRSGHSLFFVLEGKATNKSFKDTMSLNGIDHKISRWLDIPPDTFDLVENLNLFEEVRINISKILSAVIPDLR